MRIFGLILLFLLAFAVTVVLKFPVAGVLPHVNINPVKLSGVSGSVWNGSAQSVTLPPAADQPNIPINNVNWKVKPGTLLSGSAGADVDFEVLGGKGEGLVKRNLTGDVFVTDGKLQVPAKELEQFLPLPVAQFAGILLADIEELELENNLLKSTQGKLIWSNAEIISPAISTLKLGQVVFDVVPQGDLHVGNLSSSNGQLELSGAIELDQTGNYKADILIKPTADAPPQINNVLNFVGRPASDGSYRIRNNGNISNFL